MKLQIFSIFDTAVGAYTTPFFLKSKGEALRSFIDIVNDPKSRIHAHAKDYTLFWIGEWFDDTSNFLIAVTPEPLAKALEYQLPSAEPYLPFDPNKVESADQLQNGD